jgi:hypothetical protein
MQLFVIASCRQIDTIWNAVSAESHLSVIIVSHVINHFFVEKHHMMYNLLPCFI